jgi:hypothetical protein
LKKVKGGMVMQENRFSFRLYITLLCIGFFLLIDPVHRVLSASSGNLNQTKASSEKGSENSEIAKLPKIGEVVTTERALELCVHYDLSYLVKRIVDNPDNFKEWKFDGCSMTPTEVLSKAVKIPSLAEICLRHDLGYAYGDSGNEEERLKVDRQFQSDLLNAGASEFVAKSMYNAVREGGREKYCLPFSWSFARVGTCKRGSGFKIKNGK